MGQMMHYRCSRCGERYQPQQVTYQCPNDQGNLDVVLDTDRLGRSVDRDQLMASRDFSMWRYADLLPVSPDWAKGGAMSSVGWTPLFEPPRLRQEVGLQQLFVKDDGRNPTASFKDRASAVVVARALELGVERVITASTGNAGAALAGMAAAVEMPAVILAPESAPPAKVAQLLIFGADVFLVKGNYDQAFELSIEASEAFGWYCRNTGYNPFTVEGKKTAAFEICEQLALRQVGRGPGEPWPAPEAVFVSVGDGNIISGLHKGFKDLRELGWIEAMPRLYGVQSDQSDAIYRAFARGDERIEPVQATTLADSIAVDLPRDGLRALRAATETGGAYLAVPDQAILTAMSHLARYGAVFAEPAGAAAHAGLLQAVETGLVGPKEVVVLLNTGSGIKDVKSAMKAAGAAVVIEPSMAGLQAALENKTKERAHGIG